LKEPPQTSPNNAEGNDFTAPAVFLLLQHHKQYLFWGSGVANCRGLDNGSGSPLLLIAIKAARSSKFLHRAYIVFAVPATNRMQD
jgi:hypothetical protein